jgi:hypothetical protein
MKSIELRPLVFALGAGDPVILVDTDDLPTGALGDVAELTLLVGGGGLVES